MGAAVASSRLINRNVVAERGRTSMRLEPELWDALAEICVRERQDINRLVREIEATGHRGGRTSAVRVFVLKYFREAASDARPRGRQSWQPGSGSLRPLRAPRRVGAETLRFPPYSAWAGSEVAGPV